MSKNRMSRRGLLIGSALGTLGSALSVATARAGAPESANVVAAEERIRAGWTTANGWPAESGVGIGGSIWEWPIEGSMAKYTAAIGAAGVLSHLIRRYHYEVESLAPGDVVGHVAMRQRRGYESNHASGTAVTIKQGAYPRGARGGLFPQQVAALRRILDELEGLVAWGGELAPVNEAHFHLAVGPNDPRLERWASRLAAWSEMPNRGAGIGF